MIRFACPGCAAAFTVPDEKAGKAGKCPKCLMAFLIPDAPVQEAPTPTPPPQPPKKKLTLPPPPPPLPPPPPPPVDGGTVEIAPCPTCSARLSVQVEHLGLNIECPTCQTVFEAMRADAPRPPKLSGSSKSSKLIKLGSGTTEDEVEQERPSRRQKSSRSRRDEDDDRPRRRSRRRDDDDDDDEDRPIRRRRGSRSSRRTGGSGYRRGDPVPPLVMVVAVLNFLGAAGSLICGLAIMIGGTFFVSMFLGLAEDSGDPRLNSNSAQTASGLVLGMAICCGLFEVLVAGLYLFGGMGLLKMKNYGRVMTWILCVLAIMGGLGGGFSAATSRGGWGGGGASLFTLAYGVLGIIAMVKHNDDFES